MAANQGLLGGRGVPDFLQHQGAARGIPWRIEDCELVFTVNGREHRSIIPNKYIARHYDFVLSALEKDSDDALDFKEWLCETFEVTGITVDDPDLSWIQSAFGRADEACNRSTLMMIYISENLDCVDPSEKCQETREFDQHKDAWLYRTISDMSKCDRLIPIFTKKKSRFKKLPYGIGHLIGLNLEDRDDRKKQNLNHLFRNNRSAKSVREDKQNRAWIEYVSAEAKRILDSEYNDDIGVAFKEKMSVVTCTDQLEKSSLRNEHDEREKTKSIKSENGKKPESTVVYNIINCEGVAIGDGNIMTVNKGRSSRAGDSEDSSSEDEEIERLAHQQRREVEMNDEATEHDEQVRVIAQNVDPHNFDDADLMKHALAAAGNSKSTAQQLSQVLPPTPVNGREFSNAEMQASFSGQSESGLIAQPSVDISLHSDSPKSVKTEDPNIGSSTALVTSRHGDASEKEDTGRLHGNGRDRHASYEAGGNVASSPSDASLSSQSPSEDCVSSSSYEVPPEGTAV